jgi:hypothetical protein
VSESALTVVNAALQLLGAEPITEINASCTTNTRVQTMGAIYERTLKAKLREHRWNFAAVRARLAPFTCVPAYGFSCAYLLPDNALTVDETSLDEGQAWRVEQYVCDFNTTCGKVFVTDWTCSPSILYTAYIGDPTRWDPMFTRALTVELAAEAAYPITRNSQLQDSYAQKAEVLWRKAKARDGQEGRALKRFLSDALTRVRGQGGWRDPTRLG